LVGVEDDWFLRFFASRFDSSTRRAPQSLQWYCCCLRRFVPFLTIFVLPHTRQW
jgi:hypothetical protein